ncbi:PLxRFG domain-containing protein [Variovorax sp. dw_954]|uniref:PLxRFG domain-containing protein n=1 Tax=Variovorax sp. dw_954 TaxID=2720078 RepID=UPI001BD5BED5|nr:PLxRFG domain-containing protein [Variovorax sp. dw_954]
MNIKELRAQNPEWETLDDDQVVNVLHEVYYKDMTPEAIAKAIGAQKVAPPAEPRTLLRTAGDVGISALKGAISVPEAAVGLADLATGGYAGKAAEAVGFRPKEAKAMLDDMYSDQQKQAFKNVNDAQGFGGKFVAALQNPSVIAHSVVESLPSMAAGGVVGRGVMAVAPKVGGALAAGIGEGVVGGGSAAEQIRQETADGTLSAGQVGAALTTGVATTAFGALGNKVAKALGIHDVDNMLVGAVQNPAAAKGIVRRVLEGAASEGILEELPQSISEQVLQNMALGKPLDEGVDQAAVLGLLSGAAMGGGANVLGGGHKPVKQAANDPSDTAVPPANGPTFALPAPTITVGPDGTAQTADDRQGDRDALAARQGQIAERGPLSRAANVALAAGQVTDVEPKPTSALERAAQSVNPTGAINEGASDQAASDEVGQPVAGASGAELQGAAAPAAEPGMAGGMAPGVLGQGPAVGADEAGQPGQGNVGAPHPTYEAADEYRKQQKVNGANVTGLPVPTEGGFRLATKDDPEYPAAEKLRDERKLAKARADAGIIDGDLTNAKGLPFTIQLPAKNAAKKAGPGYEVVPVKGGFVARKAAAAAPAAPPAAIPGADLPNGYRAGGDEGRRYRVGESSAAGGALTLETRVGDGDPLTFYVGADGGLVNAGTVRFNDSESKARLWSPSSAEHASQAKEILDEMGRLPTADPKRKELRERLKALVAGATTTQGATSEQAPQPAQAPNPAPASQAGAATEGAGRGEAASGRSDDAAAAEAPAELTDERSAYDEMSAWGGPDDGGDTGYDADNNPEDDEQPSSGAGNPFGRPSAAPAPAPAPAAELDAQAHEAATSPQNDLPEPTQAQKEAGNYKKGHVEYQGLPITIENPRGSTRSGKSESGTEWSHAMSDHYGYVKRTEGADGDHVDVYVGKKLDATHAYIVDQIDQRTGDFDEHKVMLGFADESGAVRAYKKNFDKGWKVGKVTAMPMDQFKDWLKNGDTKAPAAEPAKPASTSTAPEHAHVGVDDRELAQIANEFNEAQEAMQGDEQIQHLFDAPAKNEIVRLADKAKVYHKDHGWMTLAEAKAKIEEWKAHAAAQGQTRANADKIVLSLFDLTGKWSQPWEEAGYQVFRFDIQDDPEVGDVHNFSTGFFGDWFGDFEGQDIYAILGACPCTDFASSGARHFAAKDADGRTVASVKLVHQTLATIEHFKPSVWAIENPVGRIEKLGGLPPWRLSFDPNHIGDPYTKKTLLWGRFNADLPVAPVEPTEGSKMHSQYGGKSQATKNARSVTPEGFAYGFFMANNAIDHPAMALANKYDRLDPSVFDKAAAAGLTSQEVSHVVDDPYYMDLDDQAAEQAVLDLIASKTPPTDPAPKGTDAPAEPPKGWRQWWDKELTGAGRTKAFEAAGFDRVPGAITPNRILWNHMKPERQAAIQALYRAGWTGEEAPAAAPAAAPAPAPKVKKESKAAREVREAEEARAAYYQPGAIVKSYSGHDRVISYTPAGNESRWSVEVQAVVKKDGQWIDDPQDNRIRTHSTQPSARELAAGPVQLAPAAAAPAAAPKADFDQDYKPEGEAEINAELDRLSDLHRDLHAQQLVVPGYDSPERAALLSRMDSIDRRRDELRKLLPEEEAVDTADEQDDEPYSPPDNWYDSMLHARTYARELGIPMDDIYGKSLEQVVKMVDAKRGVKTKKAKAAAPAPAAAPNPADLPNGKVVGRRADGQMIREDSRGVRFYTKDGVRISETVNMVPTREGMTIAKGELKPEFMTAEELAAAAPAQTPWEESRDAYNAAVRERRAAMDRQAPQPVIDALTKKLVEAQAKMKGIEGAATNKAMQAMSDRMAKEGTAQMAALPVGTRMRPSEFPESSGLYWQKTAPDTWKKVGSFGNSSIQTRTDADMGDVGGMVAMQAEAIDPPAQADHTGAPKDGNATRELDSSGPRALEGAPSEDVRAPAESGDAGQGADGSGRRDGGSDSRPDDAGSDLAGGMGAGPRDVPVSTGGTRATRKKAPKPGVSGAQGTDAGAVDAGNATGGLNPEGGPNEAPNAPPIAAPQIKAPDFTIEDDLGLGEGGQKTKFKNNVAAIRLLAKLEASGRLATPEEQRVLAQYVGWGGLPQAFDANNADWQKEHRELVSLLSEQDLEDARRSTRYAHYTSRPIIVDGIYAALRRFGFTGGKTLEAGAGVGNFLGLMPADMRSAGRFTAIEREPFSAAIAKHLYPQQIVVREDFTQFKGNDAYFDAAVGNPPFASDTQTDQSGRKHLSGLSLHNYFFAKAVDMLREGGVLAQVVTNSFLDAKTDSARKYISDRTVFLGAIRLPNSAFAKNANTEVTTDIIFLQKRPDAEFGGKAAKADAKRWLDIGRYTDKNGKVVALNQYFIDNPDMMLGDFGGFGTMYGPDQPALVARDGQDTLAILKEAVAKLPEGVYQSIADTGTANQTKAAIVALKNPTVSEGGYLIDGDKLMQRLPDLGGEARATEVTPETQWTEKTKLGESGFARIKALAGMRSTLRGLIAAEMADDDKGMGQLRATLNQQYDAYRKEHGLINDPSTLRVFEDDPDFPLLASLEHGYVPGIGPAAAKRQGIKPTKSTAKKAPIFERRVVAARTAVQKVETPADALAVSMAERGKLDAAYIGKLLGRDADEVLRELASGDKPALFRDPATDEYVLRDAYLSGNVRAKLAQAREAGMSANARALEEVQPEDVGASQITARIGSPWVPTEVYRDFAIRLFGEGTKAHVMYTKLNSSFQIAINPGNNVAYNATWGTPEVDGGSMLTALLNNRAIKVTYRDRDGKTHTDVDATERANLKASEIKEAFNDWLFTDGDRAEKLVRAYNDTNNNYVTRQYDGSMMTFPGKVPDDVIKFRRHQRNAIARTVQDRTALYDHVVGAGKTFTVVASAMELKRTGLASKPMVAVPNHLVKQWAADFYRLYPGANILTATKKDFERANRRKFLAKIATGDWDAVVIAHSSFGFIKPAPEFEAEFNKREIKKIMATIKQVEADDGDKPAKKRTVKQLEAMKERLENRIKSLRDKPMDDLLDFEQIGVDQLFVDEFHMFKNLMFSTKMQNVQGLGDSEGSQRAYDMLVKINQIFAKNGRGQGVVGATGTPVSNSLAEMYHMMRYLMPQQMEELGFESFDAWANTFASVEQVWMQKPSGDGFKASSRMSNFVNTPELLKMFDQVCDTVTMDDIKAAYREENDGAEFPLPKLKGDRRTPVSLDKTPAQEDYMTALAARALAVEQRKGPPKKGEDNVLVIMGDGRKAAMDIRLVDLDRTEREPGGRIDRASEQILTRYKQFANVKGTQLVFSDLGTPIKHAKAELKEYAALKERVAAATEDVNASAALGNEAAMAILEDAAAAQEEIDAKGPDWFDAVKAAERGFSVYDDLRQALIEKGIPEHEIAFIHDYNTDDQKAALFRKVNAGDIRVVLGSTAKMGAGTNVQERLVALHHLDVPWRPSDVEQREGRIIRQGNVLMTQIPGFEVEILAYVTKDTLDMRMWQVQETKLKMINQLRTRQVGREIDNAFEDLELSAGEMQAAATGNIDLLHEIQLRADVKKLEQRKRSFDANRNEMVNRRRRNAETLEALPKRIAERAPLADQAEAYEREAAARLDDFKATIDGKEFTDWREPQAYLREVDERKVPTGEKDDKGEPVMRAAPIKVDINGETYTARAAMAEAFSDLRGDTAPILWEVNGQEYRRRTRLASAIRQGVVDALADETTKQLGTIGGFDVAVEGSLDRAGDRMLEITVSKDGQVVADTSRYVKESLKAADSVIGAVENLLDSLTSDQSHDKRYLERAKKEKADLDATAETGEWPDQGKLDAARAKHKAVLARLSGKGDKKSAAAAADAEAELNQAQTGNPVANTADVVFSRADAAAGGMPIADVKRAVDAITSKWANSPPVVVVSSLADPQVPEAVRVHDAGQSAQGASGNPEGFYYKGTVYILADEMRSDEHVARVLFHEALGHFGLRGVFGDSLAPILDQLAAVRQGDVAAKAREYGLDMTKPGERRAAAEEVLAEMAQARPEIGFVQRAIAAVRTWLRENVAAFKNLSLSDAEIVRDFLLPARGFVERGRAASVNASADTMFSRSATAQAVNDPRQFRQKAQDMVADLFNSPGVVSWWHKTVGTMHDLAQRSPQFKRVYDAVQTFLQDVSYYANEAADLAPRILPKLDSLRDLKKSALSAEETKGLSRPVFEGTLIWGRDQDGRLFKMADLEARYAKLSTEEKASMLLRKRLVTPEQLRAWQGSKLDVYEGAVRNRFEEEFLKPGVVFTDKELRDTFGSTPTHIELYREFRAATDKSLNRLGISEMLRFGGKDTANLRDMVMDAPTASDAAIILRDALLDLAEDFPDRRDVLIDTANKMVEKGDKIQGLIDRGYAPLSRYGQYTLDVVDADGNRVFFGMYEGRLERGKWARKMMANYPGATITQGTNSEQSYKLFNGITPETLELFGEMVGLEADGDDIQHQMFQQYLKLAKSNRSAMKRLIERKGIDGYSEDAGRVLAGFVYSNGRMTSQNLHQGEITQATNDIPKDSGQLKDMAVKLADYVRNPQEEAQKIRGMLFTHYLGGSLASAMVNMTQPFAVTMPYLSQYGGIAKSAQRMKDAVRDVLKHSTGDAKLDAALKHAEAEGIVAPQEVHQLMAQARGQGALKASDGTRFGDIKTGVQNAGSKLGLLWGKPFALAEQFNRRVTFIAAYRTAVEQGIANPAKFAETAIADTQFVYNKGNKPQWARGAVGGIVFTFKQYSISYLELLHRMATQGGPEGKKAALFALAMLFLLGGAGGIPFMSDAEDLIDGIMQRLGYNFSTKQVRRQFFIDTLGAGAGEFIERGVSGIPGMPIDVAGRMGMGNLLPGTGLLVKKEDHSKDVAEFAGPAADLAQRVYQGAGLAAEGKVVQGATMMAPKAAENLRKGLEMMIDGQYRDAKGRKVMDTSFSDGLVKAIGFQPADVAKVQEATSTAQNYVAQNRMAKQDFAADMAQAVYDKDSLAQQAVREQVREWNRKNPHSPMTIDMAAVRRRVMAMRADKATRIAKAAPKAIRAEVRSQLTEGATN